MSAASSFEVPGPADGQASTGRELIRLAQIIVRLEEINLKRLHGLSYRQMRILKHIHDGVTTSSVLAGRFGVTPPAISEAVESMVQRGLVQRHFGAAADRRSVMLTLTDAGERLCEVTQESEDCLARDILAFIGPADVKRLGGIVGKLADTNQQRLFDQRQKGAKRTGGHRPAREKDGAQQLPELSCPGDSRRGDPWPGSHYYRAMPAQTSKAGDPASDRVAVGRELIRLAQIIVRLEEQEMIRCHGLSYRQMRILKHVHGGVTSTTELARQFAVTAPAISETVESMVKKGLVERRFGAAADRREVTLALTAEGERLYLASERSEDKVAAEILASISAETEERLGGIVASLVDNNQEMLFKRRRERGARRPPAAR